MSVPASYGEYATATWQGRDGAHVWTLYGPSGGAPGSPAALSLSQPPGVAFGDADDVAFGGGLLAWSVDYVFSDGESTLDGLLDGADPEDYLCHLTGPDGHGGTYSVWTRPIQGESQGSASPLLTNGDGRSALGSHDGLASLKDMEGSTLTDVALHDALGGLWHALPGGPGGIDVAAADFFEIHASFPISAPEEAATVLLDDLRLTADPAGDPSKGDVGSVGDQLRALAEAGTLTIYQPSDAGAAAPVWEVAPRSRVGSALSVTEITSAGAGVTATVASGTLTSRAEALPAFEEDKPRTGRREVRRAGLLTLKGPAPVRYGLPAQQLADTETATLEIGRFVVTPDLRFRTYSVQTSGVGFETPGELRLVLAGDDGTTYYGPGWGTTPVEMTDPEDVTTADLPVAGTVRVDWVGGDNSGGDPADWAVGWVGLEDDTGATVSDFVVRAGTPGGRAVEIALMPPLEAWDGAAWADVTEYDGLVSGDTAGAIATIQAAERAAQQGADLRALVVNARGLWGPQSRFTLGGSVDSSNTLSPFAEDCIFVPVSGEWDLQRGYSRLTLVSVAES